MPRKPGRPQKLTKSAEQKLIKAMAKNPLDYNLPYAVWDKHMVMLYYNKKKLGQRVKETTFQNVLTAARENYKEEFFGSNKKCYEPAIKLINQYEKAGYFPVYFYHKYLTKRLKVKKTSADYVKPYYHLFLFRYTIDEELFLFRKIFPSSNLTLDESDLDCFIKSFILFLNEIVDCNIERIVFVSNDSKHIKNLSELYFENRNKDDYMWMIEHIPNTDTPRYQPRINKISQKSFTFLTLPKCIFSYDFINKEELRLFDFLEENTCPTPIKGFSNLSDDPENNLLLLQSKPKFVFKCTEIKSVKQHFDRLCKMHEYKLNNCKKL